ncbi:hypothetical protein NE237_031724 [Protea cynaroides]|uniref:Uncharacterized protein n=1 Tax=Protea cynaroides TaxID=273540 RepID=A0A9Q0L1Q5_9MAGN|nr:hypothetical protein NE237_031724 [Protea cynaroides]
MEMCRWRIKEGWEVDRGDATGRWVCGWAGLIEQARWWSLMKYGIWSVVVGLLLNDVEARFSGRCRSKEREKTVGLDCYGVDDIGNFEEHLIQLGAKQLMNFPKWELLDILLICQNTSMHALGTTLSYVCSTNSKSCLLLLTMAALISLMASSLAIS